MNAAQTRQKAGDLSQQDVSRIEIDAARVGVDKSTARLDLARAVIALAQVTPGRGLAAASVGPVEWPVVPLSALPSAIADDCAKPRIGLRGDVKAPRERLGGDVCA